MSTPPTRIRSKTNFDEVYSEGENLSELDLSDERLLELIDAGVAELHEEPESIVPPIVPPVV